MLLLTGSVFGSLKKQKRGSFVPRFKKQLSVLLVISAVYNLSGFTVFFFFFAFLCMDLSCLFFPFFLFYVLFFSDLGGGRYCATNSSPPTSLFIPVPSEPSTILRSHPLLSVALPLKAFPFSVLFVLSICVADIPACCFCTLSPKL